ncbi:unnamed protein product [Urochloa humidicola]
MLVKALALNWSSSLLLYLKLLISQYTLHGPLLINAHGFLETSMTRCMLKIYSGVSVMVLHSFREFLIRWQKLKLRFNDLLSNNFQITHSVPSAACTLSVAVTIVTIGTLILNPSKCAILWLPECYDCEADSVSGHWMFLNSRIAVQQLFLWDSGGDRCLFAELESISGMGKLWGVQHKLSV